MSESTGGARPDSNIYHTILIDGFITGINRLAIEPMCKYHNDAAAYYDWIIPPHAIICSHKFEVPDTVYKLATNRLKKTQYYVRTARRTSLSFYSTTTNNTVHRSGQGSGFAESNWLFIKEHMIWRMEKEYKGCYMSIPIT